MSRDIEIPKNLCTGLDQFWAVFSEGVNSQRLNEALQQLSCLKVSTLSSHEEKEAIIQSCERWLQTWIQFYKELELPLSDIANGKLDFETLAKFGERFEAEMELKTGLDLPGNMLLKDLFCNWFTDIENPNMKYWGRATIASMLAHDLVGVEVEGWIRMGTPYVFVKYDNAEVKEVAYQEAEWARLSRVGVLKFIGTFQMAIYRLGASLEGTQDEFSLEDLVRHTAQSVEFRYSNLHKDLPGLKFNIDVESGIDSKLIGNQSLIYLVLMNVFKNTAKIMIERQIPQDQQEVAISIFERENILFMHYEDLAGGLDLSAILNSGVGKVRQAVSAKAQNQLSPALSLIQSGPFQACQQITIQQVCDLIFEGRITARRGGSGIGLTEAKEVLALHGAYIKATPNFDGGTQILISFPKDKSAEAGIDRTFFEVQSELDQKTVEKLGLAI